MQIGAILGVIALNIGVAAIGVGQPNHMWFPLLLGGGLLVVVFGSLSRTMPGRYEQLELQKMRALDLV